MESNALITYQGEVYTAYAETQSIKLYIESLDWVAWWDRPMPSKRIYPHYVAWLKAAHPNDCPLPPATFTCRLKVVGDYLMVYRPHRTRTGYWVPARRFMEAAAILRI